ncbi:hypothetical protein D7W79_26590 [Corallococcus exercitus]|nr:hypothetical protein D7W79_26590 [Corallococcus exercitus]
MKRLLLLLPLWALAGCKDPQDGVKVTVTYAQFVPGCVRVTAVDDASGDTLATDVAVREKKPGPNGQIVVGLLLPEKWGPDITVVADGYEAVPKDGACSGKAVTNQKQGIKVPKGSTKDGKTAELTLKAEAADLDGDGYVSDKLGGSDCDDNAGVGASINPGATELCNDRDDNCDGQRDEGLGLGEACTGTNACAGTKACGVNGTVICNSPDPEPALVDKDEDKYAALGQAPVPTCKVDGKLPSNRLPLSAPATDCDDNNANVHPGVTDLCNGADDNCSGSADEDFHIGDACADSASLCAGTTQCATPTTTRCQVTAPIPTWYPDNDLDTYGTATGAVSSCPKPNAGAADFADKAGDCDDGNPFIHPNATELCDEQDNDCNPATVESCATTPTWAVQTVPDDTANWLDVSQYNDGGVWIVGNNSARAVKKPGATSFTSIPGNCTTGSSVKDLYSVWANPLTGTAYIGRNEGVVIIQKPSDTTCTPRVDLSNGNANVNGLIGFEKDGGVQIFGAASMPGNPTHGGRFEWDGGTDNVSVAQVNNTPFTNVHGQSPNLLFTVGQNASGRAAIFRRGPSSTTWSSETVPDAPALNDIHVVNEKLAFAVGDDRTLLKWDGNSWTKVEGLPVTDPPTAEKYTGVLAFGANSIYVITESGSIYRYNGTGWAQAAKLSSLYGIDGTSPEDIWVVGGFGKVLHYPAWPQ